MSIHCLHRTGYRPPVRHTLCQELRIAVCDDIQLSTLFAYLPFCSSKIAGEQVNENSAFCD